MLKVLVTGGAGYLGSILTKMLLTQNYSVTVLDHFRHGTPSLADCCVYPNLTLERGDARDEHVLLRLVPKADVIIPLAALVGVSMCSNDASAANSTNYDAINTLCSIASNKQVILYPNTNSGYGIGSDAECVETDKLNPISLYGRTKVDAEKLVLNHPGGFSFRFATLFGASPRMRLDLLVNDFVYRAVTDRSITLFESHFRRNYLHVRDAAKALIFGIENRYKLSYSVFNVGLNDANLTKAQLCSLISTYTALTWNEAKHGKDPDKRDYIVSNKRITDAGFRPNFSLDDGIQELIKLYQMPFQSYRNG